MASVFNLIPEASEIPEQTKVNAAIMVDTLREHAPDRDVQVSLMAMALYAMQREVDDRLRFFSAGLNELQASVASWLRDSAVLQGAPTMRLVVDQAEKRGDKRTEPVEVFGVMQVVRPLLDDADRERVRADSLAAVNAELRMQRDGMIAVLEDALRSGKTLGDALEGLLHVVRA